MKELLPLLCCLLTTACSGPTVGAGQSARTEPLSTARIIVGFDRHRDDPGGAQLLARLGEALTGTLEYLHRTGGNAAVYRLTTSLQAVELRNRLARLAGRDGIEYAELDRRRRIPAPAGEEVL